MISLCIGDYESLKKENTLIGQFYSTDECVNNNDIDHDEANDISRFSEEPDPYEDREEKF